MDYDIIFPARWRLFNQKLLISHLPDPNSGTLAMAPVAQNSSLVPKYSMHLETKHRKHLKITQVQWDFRLGEL